MPVGYLQGKLFSGSPFSLLLLKTSRERNVWSLYKLIFLIYFEELEELQAEIIQLWLNQEKYNGSKEQERIKWTVFRLDLSHRLEKAQLIKTLKGELDWLYNFLLGRSTEQKGGRKSWEGSCFWSKFRKFTKSWEIQPWICEKLEEEPLFPYYQNLFMMINWITVFLLNYWLLQDSPALTDWWQSLANIWD